MTKKSAAQAFWIVLIGALTIIGLLFIVTLFGKTKALAEDLSDYHICRDGNIGVVQTRINLKGWVVAEQGVKHCKTEQVNVPSGKEYEAIAKKMALCWDMYLNGKEELFPTSNGNYCAFCSVLDFEDKNKKLNSLSKYLSENKVKSSDTSYMQYLSGIEAKSGDKEKLDNIELQNNAYIDTSKKQAIIFTMYKEINPGGIGSKGLNFLAGGVAGTGVGLGISYFAGAALCSTFIGCFAGVSLVAFAGSGAGSGLGYLIGSDISADWRARILVSEYDRQKLEQLKCTQLEGMDYLKIQKK